MKFSCKPKNLSLYRKFILTFTCTCILPFAIISLYLFSIVYRTIKNDIINSYRENAVQYVDSIEYKLQVYKSCMDGLIVNQQLQALLNSDASSDNSFEMSNDYIYRFVSLYSKNQNEIYDIALYNSRSYIETPSQAIIKSYSELERQQWFSSDILEKRFDEGNVLLEGLGLRHQHDLNH